MVVTAGGSLNAWEIQSIYNYPEMVNARDLGIMDMDVKWTSLMADHIHLRIICESQVFFLFFH